MDERNPASYVPMSAKKPVPPVLPTHPNPIRSGEAGEHHDRHAAITGKISDWNDYRRWVQTIRDNLKKEEDGR
jgi:hypothetical protein